MNRLRMQTFVLPFWFLFLAAVGTPAPPTAPLTTDSPLSQTTLGGSLARNSGASAGVGSVNTSTLSGGVTSTGSTTVSGATRITGDQLGSTTTTPANSTQPSLPTTADTVTGNVSSGNVGTTTTVNTGRVGSDTLGTVPGNNSNLALQFEKSQFQLSVRGRMAELDQAINQLNLAARKTQSIQERVRLNALVASLRRQLIDVKGDYDDLVTMGENENWQGIRDDLNEGLAGLEESLMEAQ